MNDKNQPLVTIALPTYNRLTGLKNSLECFLNQSYKNLEIIISDNHSEIDPTDCIESYRNYDDRIKFYRQAANIGMKANGDFLLSLATGKYFLLGSDDDWWDSNFIEKMVCLLEENPNASCAISDFQETLTSGERAIYRSNFSRIKHLLFYKSSKFPDHLPLLMDFTHDQMLGRLEKFIKQSEADGKANIHRALCKRTDFINSVSDLYNLGLAECWGFDQLLAFMLLIKGKLVISPELMFKCTVNNPKNYQFEFSKIEYLLGYDLIINTHLGKEGVNSIKNILNAKFMDKKIGFQYEFYNKLYLLYKLVINTKIGDERVILLKNINIRLQMGDFLEVAKIMQKTIHWKEFKFIGRTPKFRQIVLYFIKLKLFFIKIKINKIIF